MAVQTEFIAGLEEAEFVVGSMGVMALCTLAFQRNLMDTAILLGDYGSVALETNFLRILPQ